GNPYGVAVSPDGRSVYVANSELNTLSQYDVGQGGELTPKSPAAVAAGGCPSWPAVSPDGKSAYLTDTCGNTLPQDDVGPGGALTPKSPAFISVASFTLGGAVSPDSKSVYVTGTDFSTNASAVLQFDVGSGGALTPKSPAAVSAGFGAIGVVVSTDGRSVYVAAEG